MNHSCSSPFLFALLLLGGVSAQAEGPSKKTPPPFQSSEKFEYVAEKTDPLIGLIKSDTFQGIILRPDASMESLRRIDDHLIPTPKAVAKVDEKTCREAINRMLGPDQGEDPAIKIEKVEMFKGRKGEACEVEAADVKAAPNPKRYRAMIGLHQGKLRALVAQDKSATAARPDESDEFRKFFQSLK